MRNDDDDEAGVRLLPRPHQLDPIRPPGYDEYKVTPSSGPGLA